MNAQSRDRVVNASYVPIAEKRLAQHDVGRARRELDAALQQGLIPIILGDKEWPALLADIE